MRFPKMSRLTAPGWLVFYDYKDAAPTALRLSAGNFVRRDTRLCDTRYSERNSGDGIAPPVSIHDE
jgi:hypothetical protein